MNPRQVRFWLIGCLIWLSAFTANAHEVRPAYLNITETAPAEFSVLWKQPVLQGKRLKIKPSFPENCANTTPQIVWREMRLQHARWRLMNSKRTITQIAHECGFADSSHFARWFRVRFSETPGEYRKNRLAKQR